MAKTTFKQGEFVRRCLTSGIPVGGICVIDDVEEKGLYVHHLPIDVIGSFYVKKTEVIKLKMIRLAISNKDAKMLSEKCPYAFKRTCVPSWQNAKGRYDIVILTSPDRSQLIIKDVVIWEYFGGDIAIRWQEYLKIGKR